MKRLLCAVWLGLPLAILPLQAGAQSNSSPSAKPRPADRDKALRAKAVERCKANRGVDCETADGLKEWIDQERARAHRRPPKKK